LSNRLNISVALKQPQRAAQACTDAAPDAVILAAKLIQELPHERPAFAHSALQYD
jgi:hypothetical protein